MLRLKGEIRRREGEAGDTSLSLVVVQFIPSIMQPPRLNQFPRLTIGGGVPPFLPRSLHLDPHLFFDENKIYVIFCQNWRKDEEYKTYIPALLFLMKAKLASLFTHSSLSLKAKMCWARSGSDPKIPFTFGPVRPESAVIRTDKSMNLLDVQIWHHHM